MPFGWLLIEIHPGDAPASDWPELAEICQNQHGPARQWAEKQSAQKAQLTAKRQAAEQRRQQEETERKQQLEQKQAEEQTRQAKQQAEQQRRATMSAEQLQIEALRQQLAQKQTGKIREQIGGPLYSDLRKLIEQAAGWPADAKADLLDAATSIVAFIGAGGNKKAKELLKTLHTP